MPPKRSSSRGRGSRRRSINADDAFGQSLADAARARGRKVLTYGLANADVAATGIATASHGLALSVSDAVGTGRAPDEALSARSTRRTCSGASRYCSRATSRYPTRSRRSPRSRRRRGACSDSGGHDAPLVVVDYAHSPDALEKVLRALRPAVADGRELVCVFGCGGDRDAGKRPEMGRVAATLANRVIVTTDNPRSEDPAAIASAIVHGVRATSNRRWTVDLDRATAINAAISGAKTGDVVLVAGKGHEDYQEANGVRAPFSDVEAATAALTRRGAG